MLVRSIKESALHLIGSSVLRQFLRNTLLVLLIPLILLATGNRVLQSAMTQKLLETEGRVLMQMVSNLDAAIHGIRQDVAEISSNADIRGFSHVARPFTAEDRYKASRLVNALSKYLAYDTLIEGFFLYFPRSHVVLNYSAMYEPDFFHEFALSYPGNTYEDWIEYQTRQYHQADYMVSDSTITYITSLPVLPNVGPDMESQAVLNIQISKRVLSGQLNGILPGGALYVYDHEDKLLCAVGNTQEYASPLPSQQADVVEDDSITTIYRVSEDTGWRYYLIIPNAVLAGDSLSVFSSMWWLVLSCLLLGIVFALVFSYVNYKPIGKLRDVALSYQADENAQLESGNDLELIRSSLHSVHEDNRQLAMAQEQVLGKYEHLRRLSMRNQQLLTDGLVMRLVHGQVEDWDAMQTWLETADARFDQRNSIVAMAVANDYSKFVKPGSEADESALVMFAMQSVMEDMFETIGRCHSVAMQNDTLLLLINTDKGEESIQGVFRAVVDFLHQKAQILTTIGLGTMQESISGISLSYEQAKQALEYRFVAGKGRIIPFSEIKTEPEGVIRLSQDRLRQMSQAVIRRDAMLLAQMLDMTYEEIVHVGAMSMLQAQSFYYDIIHMAMRTLDDVNADTTAIFGEEFDPLAAFSACDTMEEVLETLRHILTRVCGYTTGTSIRTQKIAAEAISFIEANFHRLDFSQTMVAEAVGVSPTYLSRIIKHTQNQNMVDIIGELRVSRAQEYLLTTDMNLADIAERVGLGTVKSLIRIFKQYTGTTPGRMREMHGEERTCQPNRATVRRDGTYELVERNSLEANSDQSARD